MKYIYWAGGIIILLIISWVFFIMPNNKDTRKVMVYFAKSEATQIITVGVERYITASTKPEIILQRTISQLLLGPSESEKSQGLYSALDSKVKLNSINLYEKIATLDFNEALDFQIGGSARVLAIREQLEKTVLAFNSINQLILTVNRGEREAILEP